MSYYSNKKENKFKPLVFIGCSSESLAVAKIIEKRLKKETEVNIWNKDTFILNKSVLEMLFRSLIYHDFAIFIFAPDDKVISREEDHFGVRDNVIFEAGLFLGRLGPNKAFIFAEKSVKILSDLTGISLALYDNKELEKSLKESCDNVLKIINDSIKKTELTVLPSTALAVGYFENFINKVVGALDSEKEVKKEEEKIKFSDFKLNILIPNRLSDVTRENLRFKLKKLDQIRLKTGTRIYPFYISAKLKKKEKLVLYDIPTTLLASKLAIKRLVPQTDFGKNITHEILEKREIRNFAKTLEFLIEDTYGDFEHVSVCSLSSFLKD